MVRRRSNDSPAGSSLLNEVRVLLVWTLGTRVTVEKEPGRPTRTASHRPAARYGQGPRCYPRLPRAAALRLGLSAARGDLQLHRTVAPRAGNAGAARSHSGVAHERPAFAAPTAAITASMASPPGFRIMTRQLPGRRPGPRSSTIRGSRCRVRLRFRVSRRASRPARSSGVARRPRLSTEPRRHSPAPRFAVRACRY